MPVAALKKEPVAEYALGAQPWSKPVTITKQEDAMLSWRHNFNEMIAGLSAQQRSWMNMWPADILEEWQKKAADLWQWNNLSLWRQTNSAWRKLMPAIEPALNLKETTEAYHIRLDLPGLAIDDIELSVSDHYLTVSGERKEEKEDDETNLCCEVSYGAFRRSFTLPRDAAADLTTAVMHNGVLCVEIPKKSANDTNLRRLDIKQAG